MAGLGSAQPYRRAVGGMNYLEIVVLIVLLTPVAYITVCAMVEFLADHN